MAEDQITIDRDSLNAIALPSRISILKALAKRRKTQSELSKEVGLSPSTVSEHLQILARAGLVSKQDTGRKWVYYSLTGKGKVIIGVEKSRTKAIVFTLVLLFAVSFIYLAAFVPRTGTVQNEVVPVQEPRGPMALPETGAQAPVISPQLNKHVAEKASPMNPPLNQSPNSTSGS